MLCAPAESGVADPRRTSVHQAKVIQTEKLVTKNSLTTESQYMVQTKTYPIHSNIMCISLLS